MKKLFDASAIMLLIKNYPREAVNYLIDEHLLDLTIYEMGNTIWKINKVLKKTDQKTALESIEQVLDLINLMKINTIQDKETFIAIMQNAFQHNLTYYDSSYLTQAQNEKYTLVTEDKELQKAANTVNVSSVNTEKLRE